MVRYWMHNGLVKKSEAQAKSVVARPKKKAKPQSKPKSAAAKVLAVLAALIEKHTGERIRFFLLRTHYRSTVVFDDEGLEEAGQRYQFLSFDRSL